MIAIHNSMSSGQQVECYFIRARAFQYTKDQRQRANKARSMRPWYLKWYWPFISQEEAWHNNHGMGLQYLTERLMFFLAAGNSEYNVNECIRIGKEIEELNKCIIDHVNHKNYSDSCKGAFWNED